MAATFAMENVDLAASRMKAFDITVVSHTDGSGTSEYTIIPTMAGHALWGAYSNPVDGPTDNWDFYIEDENGVDLMGAAGEDRDTTTSELAHPTTDNNAPPLVTSRVRVRVANMGSAKSAVIRPVFVPI